MDEDKTKLRNGTDVPVLTPEVLAQMERDSRSFCKEQRDEESVK